MIPLYAHRLGRAYGPDNSRAALAGALAVDADGLECDVCLTADGELVLLHDPWLASGTDLEGWAHGRTSAELRRARLSGGDAPLFVDELLAVAPRDLVLQFDVKSHADPELATRTVEALAATLARASGRRVEVLSFLGVCVEHFVLSRPLVAALRRAATFGVDAVTTDDPAALRARLTLAA